MTEHVIWVVMRRHVDGDSVECWRHTESEATDVALMLDARRSVGAVGTYRVVAVSDVPDELKPKSVDPLADLVIEYAPIARGHGQVLGMEPRPAVRIRHVPTGLEVMVDSERSQHANRAVAAREMLASLSGREDEGIVPHADVIAQLSAWADAQPPAVLEQLDMTAPAVPLTAEQHRKLIRDTAERNERWAKSRRRPGR